MNTLPDRPLPYGEVITPDLVDMIVDRIVRAIHPLKIIVFGSCARGNPGPDSDLDILVIMNTDVPRYKRGIVIRELFYPQPCPMDILVYTPEEVDYWIGTVNHIITEAFETGKVYYEQKAA
ncbi:MAG: nucleotidyltransferase domain-containing protein [Chitinivibrionales bacterium]|nr:nucleotidyltransferase domain-containing protein [Chitinivibrionales bacterium]